MCSSRFAWPFPETSAATRLRVCARGKGCTDEATFRPAAMKNKMKMRFLGANQELGDLDCFMASWQVSQKKQ